MLSVIVVSLPVYIAIVQYFNVVVILLNYGPTDFMYTKHEWSSYRHKRKERKEKKCGNRGNRGKCN